MAPGSHGNLSHLLAIQMHIIRLVKLSHCTGLPKVLTPTQASLAAVITFVLSLYLSKVSVVAFLVRITSQNRDVWVYRISLAMVSALGLASVFVVTTGWPLDIDSYWASYITAEACSTQTMRWSVFTAFDIITEILLLVLPLYMSWDLQMPLRRKVIVVGAFYLRLPLIGLSVGRYIYTKRLCAKGVDLGLDSALVLICLCIESAFALVASQFLAFRRFTLSFNSGFGLGFTVHAGPESYSMQRTGIKSNGNGGGSGNGRFWSRRGGSRQSPSTDSQNAAAARPMPPTLLDGQPVLTTHNGAHFRALSVPGHDWPEDRSSSGETTVDDMVIMREQEFSVQYQDNDESPILNRQGHTIRHSAKGAS